MALNKSTPRPGALKQAISNAGMTQAEFAKKARCSRTTLQKIDRGEPVKAETLDEIAQVLGLPVAHLLGTEEKPEDTGPDQIVVDEDEIFGTGTWVKILMRRLKTTEDISNLLRFPGEISWSLNAGDIAKDQETALLSFEESINQFRGKNLTWLGSRGPSLTKLIEDKKAATGIEAQIKDLADNGLYVYGAKYIQWNEDREIYSHEDNEYEVLVYTSKRVSLIAIDITCAQSMRLDVCIGYPPPRHATAENPRIKVDGRWLETETDYVSRRMREDPDYIPF